MAAKTYYHRIDVAKFLLAFFVVAAHTLPLTPGLRRDYVLNYIFHMTVPFYFMAMGFLLVSGSRETSLESVQSRLRKNIRHILQMYLVWTLIYLPITVQGFSSWGMGFSDAVSEFINQVVCIGENNNSWPLWFLLSSFYGLILIYIELTFFHWKHTGLYLTAIGCLGLCLFTNFGHHAAPGSFAGYLFQSAGLDSVLLNGRIFLSPFYITLGMAFAEHREELFRISRWKLTGFCALMCVLNILILDYNHPSDFNLFLPFGSVFLFAACVVPYEKPCRICSFLRKSSTVIYLTHMIWFVLFTWLFLGDLGCRRRIAFLAACAGSLLTSLLLLLDKKGRISRYLL